MTLFLESGDNPFVVYPKITVFKPNVDTYLKVQLFQF